MPSISIIVPIFNGIRYLPHFLQSLAEAAPSEAELILVDDGSSEPVLELVPRDFPVASITTLRSETNSGYSVAVNRGFAHATGEILIQLNTDLVLDQHCIDAMVDLIEATPRAGVIGSKQIFPTTGLIRHIGMAFGGHSFHHVYSGLPANHPLCCQTRKMQLVSGATVAMTRQVLEQIGPLDERYYNTLENFDHCMKAHMGGYSNYTCAESVVYHWVSQSGPARFARVREGDAIFWADWTPSRSIDLDSYVTEALAYLLNCHPYLGQYRFEPLSLCRSSDESILLDCLEQIWSGVASKTHLTRILNSPHEKLWLPMELPYRAMLNPAPYIYLVDRLSQLSENMLWFEARKRFVDVELVIDTRAVVMTTNELQQMYGGT
jgi:GT2 family glycosyltransferase